MGFNPLEVSVEMGTGACGSGVCLVNHFRGRVTCPGGQTAADLDGGAACLTPGTCQPVAVQVAPQCADRPSDQTVSCSCRCANAAGRTDDGATYCTCPGSMTCVQLVSMIGAGPSSIAGAYCILAGTEYSADAACM